ncbi:surfeit locus protein 1 isoform X1 [Mycetomoellerius zeteki]|uniref:surfeit locus protein 1 isoform X1 n=1 Tax=Mycetomoellerius zeteki TaxID=64791 RepID=UPI00084EA8DA|nr:PREDICTED: surfeit locus protein 1 isoform X1 [Trachymyrmex zeteki]
MNLTKIFGFLRDAKCAINRRVHVSLFGNVNTQARCKSSEVKLTRPAAIETNRYRKSEEKIGLYGYSLLGVPVITFALGTWQIKRWRWKLDLIEKLKQRTSAEPIDLPSDLNELKDKEYYRIKVKGKFLYEKEFLIGPRSLIINGEAVSEKGGGIFSRKTSSGYYVITPFKLEDRDLIIMVNRGWIPRCDRSTYKMGNKIIDSIEITGIIRATEKRPPFVLDNTPAKGVWHYRDLNAMAKVAEAEPVYIELLAEYNIPQGPIGGQTKVTLRDEHLSYIITWYSLSACTSYMWFRQFIQKLPLI